MSRLLFVLPLFFGGCLYINQDIGVTTYQYEKCIEYYDENGTYYKECPQPATDKSVKVLKKASNSVVETVKDLGSAIETNLKEIFFSDFFSTNTTNTKKICVCKKSCMNACKLTKVECLKKCCHEKK